MCSSSPPINGVAIVCPHTATPACTPPIWTPWLVTASLSETEIWRATTEGDPIAEGTEVRVVDVRGARLVVDPVE